MYKSLGYRNKINYLEILAKALDNNISRELYSIGAYREEAFCIEEKDSEWIVYVGERGRKHDIRSFRNAREACYYLIAMVSESDAEEMRVRNLFYYLMKSQRPAMARRKRAAVQLKSAGAKTPVKARKRR